MVDEVKAIAQALHESGAQLAEHRRRVEVGDKFPDGVLHQVAGSGSGGDAEGGPFFRLAQQEARQGNAFRRDAVGTSFVLTFLPYLGIHTGGSLATQGI